MGINASVFTKGLIEMVQKLTFNILAFLSKGQTYGQVHSGDVIENILFDSRRLNNAAGTCFFALVTPTGDGSKFVDFLYSKGLRMFVIQKDLDHYYADASYLKVNNVSDCLQLLAASYRSLFTLPVCAVTGSNGKTITKDWIVRLTAQDKKICSTIRSYNSQLGVPVCVYDLSPDDDLAVFEAGISLPGEMDRLRNIIQPSIGIFTNIGDAHQVNFPSVEAKIDEKLKLFTSVQTLIFHDDNPLLSRKIRFFAKEHSIHLIAWGDKQVSFSSDSEDYYNRQDLLKELSLPFSDPASEENALNAYMFCLHIGISKKLLQQRIRHLEQLESRFEVKSGINNSLIVNDSYSCDLKSLEVALDYLNRQNKTKKTVILSDLQQTSSDKKELFLQINKLLHNKNITSLTAVGTDFYNNQSLLDLPQMKFYLTVDDFLLNLRRKDFVSQAVLVKGATSMNFNRISDYLSAKSHQTVLEVNLSAIEDNVRYFKSLTAPSTLVMAMVKADSYGVGAYEVAFSLEKSNLADYFAVAFADEGVDLRRQGITKPIMVMTPEGNPELFLQYNLEPVVHNFSVLDKFAAYDLNIHIKLDTGMHRLGFEAQDLSNLVTVLKNNKTLRVKSVFSHLYGADDCALDAYTYSQIDFFSQMSDFICSHFDYKILRHICNSAATVRFKQAHYDMVRLGIGMYGIGVNEEQQRRLRTAHRLRTVITQVRNVKKGEDISYSRKFVAPYDMRIGVIPIGYADGLNRHLGNSSYSVYTCGTYCKIVGNVCMDMCMTDLTSSDAKEGDTVEIISIKNPVEKMSKALDTIPYEIFTSIAPRIKRIYFHE